MKRLLSFAFIALLPFPLFAADAKLEKYVERSLQNCPGSKILMERVDKPGPAGFILYRATQTSTDSRCGRAAYAMVSPASGQIIFGDIFPLTDDGRTVDERLREFGTSKLKKNVAVRIDPASLPDGIRKVSILAPTAAGPFSHGGYLDSSKKYFIIGRRGTMKTDPGKSLLDAIGISSAVTRGNKAAKVQIVELSDFQCPTCKRAHDVMEKIIPANLDKLAYSRLDLSIFEHHDWSLQAAMAARAIQKVAPQQYWKFVDYIFDHQEVINKAILDTVVRDFVDDHGVDWEKFAPLYRSASERNTLLNQIAAGYDNGIFATPTFIVNGQIIGYGTDGEYVRKFIENAIKKK